MVFVRSVQAYAENLVTVFVFVLLGALVFLFTLLPRFFLSSGTVFLEQDFLGSSLLLILVQLALVVLSLAFFSVFVAAMVFAVRQDLNKVKFSQYLSEKLPAFGLELFEFFLALFVVQLVLAFVLMGLGLPSVVLALVLVIVNALVLFVPQSVVVDERSWVSALSDNFQFISKNPGAFVQALVLGVVLVCLLPLVELYFDQFGFVGRFVSLGAALIIVIPFFESFKTVSYMSKFSLAA